MTPMTPVPAPRFRINRHRRLAWLVSGLACGLSLLGLALCWLNPAIGAPLRPGLDFTGGTQVQVERDCAPCRPVTPAEVRQGLSRLTLPSPEGERPPSLGSASVQVLDGGRSLLLRLPALEAEQSSALVDDLATRFGPLLESGTSVNTIGPTLGSRLLRGSLISLLVSFVGISVFISFRYSGIFAGLALLCLAMAGARFSLGIWFLLGLLGAAACFAWEFWSTRGRESQACFAAFLHNHWAGLAILLGIVVDYALR